MSNTHARLRSGTAALVIASLLLAGPSPLAFANGDACKGEQAGDAQVSHYCAAAKSADEASKSQKMVGMIQGGVTAVCAAACASGFWTLGISEGWCNAAAIGGAVAGLVVAKKTQDKMMSMMPVAGTALTVFTAPGGMGAGLSTAFNFTPEVGSALSSAAGPPAPGGFTMSCVSAGLAAVTAFMSFSGSSKSKKTASENRKLASEMASQNKAANVEVRPLGLIAMDAPSNPTPFGAGTKPTPFKEGPSVKNAALAGGAGSPCGGTGFSGALSCALASPDNNLPSFVSSPEFRAALERTSGMSADQLFSIEDPKQMIQAGLGKVLNDEGQRALSQILDEAKSGLEAELGSRSSVIASGGSGGSSFTLPTDSSFGAPIAEEAKELKFEPQADRALASDLGAENNPAISLFTRVSTRYQLSKDRVSALKYQGIESRILGGTR